MPDRFRARTNAAARSPLPANDGPGATPTLARSNSAGQVPPQTAPPLSFSDALRQKQKEAASSGSPGSYGAENFARRADGHEDPTAPAAPEDDAIIDPAAQAFEALETMSRRMEDLARELNCLGYFSDDDPRPRAA